MKSLGEIEDYSKNVLKPLALEGKEITSIDLELENTYGYSPRIADMIMEELLMDGVPYSIALTSVARYYKCDENIMRVLMPIHGGSNPVMGYLDGKQYSRSNLGYYINKTLRKMQDVSWCLYKITRNELVLLMKDEFGLPESTIREALIIKNKEGKKYRQPEPVTDMALRKIANNQNVSLGTRKIATDILEKRLNG